MEALSLSSISIASKNTATFPSKHGWCLLMKRRSIVHCQTGGNARKDGGLSPVATERSTLMSTNIGAAVMDSGSSLLTPNGNGKAEIALKDLVPYDRPSTSLVETHDEGIGIVKFLRGKVFLITGATGFLGKGVSLPDLLDTIPPVKVFVFLMVDQNPVLIEKILRTVPDVHKIYVMIKAKNKESAMERLKCEIINAELFKCLKQTHGKSYQSFMLSKMVPVIGNVCESNLGFNEDIADMIADEVDVIVNSAANTTFDERYDVSLDINTGGPGRLMSFAKQCHKLKLFLQISTAYVNGQREGRIMEKPFSVGDSITREYLQSGNQQGPLPTLNIEDEIKLVLESKQALDDSIVTQKMKELGLQRAKKYGWQDTYVFTKAMGEMMIDKMRGNIPIVIIRPSVVESTFKEPFPGWMEGNRMMDPIILSYGKGQLTGFLVDPSGVLDVVPADMVVNATLAAMAKHGAAGKSKCSIYQIASSVVNPLVFEDLARLLYEHFNSYPCMDSQGKPIHVPIMKLLSSKEDLSAHLWQDAIHRSGLAAFTDPNVKLSRKLETLCRKSVEQAKYLANIYEPYTFYGGRFDNSNTLRLSECMSKEERRQFGFDVESIDWRDYISNIHIPGLRQHVMKGR